MKMEELVKKLQNFIKKSQTSVKKYTNLWRKKPQKGTN